MNTHSAQALAEYVEQIESSYEYMLAYAAQGRVKENSGGDGPGIRGILERLDTAVAALASAFRECAPEGDGDDRNAFLSFCDVLERDTAFARQAIKLVLSVESISSKIVDNLNASAHVRTVLTDLFLADEALKSAS